MTANTALNKKINLFVLFACIALIFVFSPKKQLFWDEPFSILCSKGITILNMDKYTAQTSLTSADLVKENNFANVFYGGDSLYYIGLHYYSSLLNNTLNAYFSFSLIWGVLALISFYFLCKQVIGNDIFISLALFLFFTDMLFLNQTYSMRNYMISLFFLNISAIYFFRYLAGNRQFKTILLLGIFSMLAFLSHYFTGYIIIGYIIAILYAEKLAFFTKKNMVALLIPSVLLVAYFVAHKSPLGGYDTYQNYVKHGQKIDMNLSLGGAFSLALKSLAINFKLMYPLFKDVFIVRAGSAALLIALYFYGHTLILNPSVKRKYNVLFLLGAISSVFIGGLAYVSHHAMLFSFRYFLFSVPFCCLFITLFLKYVLGYKKLHIAIKLTIAFLLINPDIFEFVLNRLNKIPIPSNHVEMAQKIVADNVHKIEVPEASDAIFINCFLPRNYSITYEINSKSHDVAFYKDNTVERIYLIKNGLIAFY
jgi:uncharacterized membrane protein